jgi:DNA-binding transcriptional regulator PaaX
MNEISEKAIKLIKDLRRDIWIDVMFTPEKNAEDESLKALVDYIAELEKDNDEFRQLIHDWIIILTPDDGYVPDSECVRQAMLVIDKERER